MDNQTEDSIDASEMAFHTFFDKFIKYCMSMVTHREHESEHFNVTNREPEIHEGAQERSSIKETDADRREEHTTVSIQSSIISEPSHLVSDYEINFNHKAILRKNFLFLMDNITLTEPVLLDILQLDGVLDQRELDEIRSKATDHEGTGQLLTYILKTSHEQYQQFLEALSMSNHQDAFIKLKAAEKRSGMKNEERQELWSKLKNYAKEGIEITSWGYNHLVLDIFYLSDDGKIDEASIMSDLNSYLKRDLRINLIRLKSKPSYQSTVGPGTKVGVSENIPGQLSCVGSIGAYVEVPGRRRHALLSGHSRVINEELHFETAHIPWALGFVRAVVVGAGRDVALVDPSFIIHNNINRIERPNNTLVALSRLPIDPKYQTHVKKFSEVNDVEPGRICYPHYCRNALDLNECIAIAIENAHGTQAMHGEAESGTLVTTVPHPMFSCHVGAVGMLVGITRIEPYNENLPNEYSIAVSMDTILRELSRDPYCNQNDGKEVTIIPAAVDPRQVAE